MRVRVGIAGHSGYSGAELMRLLARHLRVDVVLLDHREVDPEGPRYLAVARLERMPATAVAVRDAHLDLVFLATPAAVSIALAPPMLAAGACVIDLSGAFRLKTPECYQRWYHDRHPEPGLLAEAVYGLPEFYRDAIPNARLVANPGCYPTAANLAIRPLIEHGLADRPRGIVCDAKSGASGAGRKPSMHTSFCEIAGNVSVYAVLEHRHVPEVLMNSLLSDDEFSFTAQLLPVERGIIETIYFRAADGISTGEILDAFARCYRNEPFIRLHAPGSRPDLHDVAFTNFCDLAAQVDQETGRGVIVSAIDNLGKGAAGQAIQNMNLHFGWPETEALL